MSSYGPSSGASFAAGFAQGFSNTYISMTQQKQKEEADLVKFNMERFLRKEDEFRAAEKADAKLVDVAKKFATANGLPVDAWGNLYNDLSMGITPNQVQAKIENGSYKKISTSTDNVITTEEDLSSVDARTSNQTDALLQTSTEREDQPEDIKIPGENFFQKVSGGMSDLFNKDKRAQKSEERVLAETLRKLDIDQSEYDRILSGYQVLSPEISYTYTGGTKDENLSFEKQAILAAKADPRWSEEDYAGNIDLLAEYKAKLSPDTTKPRTFETPKELALFNLTQSAEYKALEDDPTTQNNLLRELESSFSKNGASTTYTAGNYASEHSKYSLMLASDNPEEITEAQNWFANVKPVREEALKSVAALTKDPEEPEILALMYVNAKGKNRMGTGIASENGSYTLSDGTVVEKDQILNATTVDMADARTKAVQAASGVYKKVSDTKIAASVAAQNLMRLDRMAFDNENVLKTVAGGGSSAVSSFSKEMQGLVGLLGELQKQDPTQSSTSLLAGVNAEVDTMFADNIITDEVARAYKEFNAAIVRTIFATGKALGQQGNGFSNQDYQVISESLVNANSYEAFSNNLRRLTNELYETWDATAVDARGTGLVQNVLWMPGGSELIGNSLMGVEEYYQSDAGKSQANVYEWSKGKAKPRANGRLIETASQDDVTRGMPEAFLGEKVIMFIETGPDGKATGTVRYERY